MIHRKDQPPFTEVMSEFQGRQKSKYMLLAVNMADADTDELAVKGLILPKTAFRSIVQLLNEGYDLWSPEEGHGLTIIRSGSGLETSYSILPSQKPAPIDPAVIDRAPLFDKLKEEYTQLRERGDKKQSSSGEGNSGGEDW